MGLDTFYGKGNQGDSTSFPTALLDNSDQLKSTSTTVHGKQPSLAAQKAWRILCGYESHTSIHWIS